jgi:hypothetical protein
VASLAITLGGAAIGGAIAPAGWTFLGVSGAGLGSAVAGFAAQALLPGPHSEGPRLADTHVPQSGEGAPIPLVFGTDKVAGTPIWPRSLDLEERRQTQSLKGGGPSASTSTYFATWAVKLCQGPIDAVLRVWANNKIIYDVRSTNTGPIEKYPGTMKIHLGTEDQAPDDVIEAAKGVGATPAFLGTAYIRFKSLPLADFGNAPPVIAAEVLRSGAGANPAVSLGAGGASTVANIPGTPLVAYLNRIPDTMDVYDRVTNQKVASYAASFPNAAFDGRGFFYAQDDVGANPATVRKVELLSGAVAATASAPGPESWVYHHDLTEAARSRLALELGAFVGQATALTQPRILSTIRADSVQGALVRLFDPETMALLAIANGNAPGGTLYDFGAQVAIDAEGQVWALSKGATHAHLMRLEGTGEPASGGENLFKVEDFAITQAGGNARALGYDADAHALLIGGTVNSNLIKFDIASRAVVATVGGLFGGSGAGRLESWRAAMIQGPADGILWLFEGGGQPKIYKVDLADMELAATHDATAWAGGGPGTVGAGVYDAGAHAMNVATDNGAHRLYLDRVTDAGMGLDEAVTELCTHPKLGLQAGDLDVSALVGDVMPGTQVGAASAKSALEQWAAGFFFDGVESDHKIKFVKRGGAAVATIPEAHLGVRAGGRARVPTLTARRGDTGALPRRLLFVHNDRERDYEPAAAPAQREGGAVAIGATARLEAPIAFSREQGRRIAERWLFTEWLGIEGYEISTLPRYRRLDPADVVTAVNEGRSVTFRVERWGLGAGGRVTLEGARDEASVYVSALAGSANPATDQTIAVRVPAVLYLIDAPLLRDEDDAVAGIYVAATWFGNATGAAIEKSDGDGRWTRVMDILDPAPAGRAATALGDGPTTVFDEVGSVDAVLFQGTPESAAEIDVLNGANAMLIGDEYVQYKTATALGGRRFRFSGLLRGRRGTEQHTAAHAVGERVVLLHADWVRRLPAASDVGVARQYRAVTFGTLPEDATVETLAYQGNDKKPYSPVHIAGAWDGSDNLTITWVRRSRLGGRWADFVDVPLGEASEAYEIDILDAPGGDVINTYSSSSESFAYSAAAQTGDGLTPGEDVHVAIHQMSAFIGRGFPGAATLSKAA